MTSVQRVGRSGAGGVGKGDEEVKKEPKEPYQPLKILGGIREKGFDGDGGFFAKRATKPVQPRVKPFPIARHRSEGPHWLPRRESEIVPMPEDSEELNAEGMAALAKPLIPKKKPTLNISRWKTERNSTSTSVDGNQEHLDSFSAPEPSNAVQDLKVASEDSKLERAPEAVSRPRVTFTLPLEKNAGEAPADRSKPLEYAELSRLRSNSGASGRDQINDTGIETRSKSEEELIDEENRATIASMSASEVAVAQVELMNRLKPDVIEMLRKRSQKKNSKEGKGAEKEVDARPVAMNVVVESDSSPERKEAGKGSNTHEISESGEAPVGALKNQEENHAPAPQLDSVPLTVPALGWSKSWIERVEAVRLYRFDMQGHLVAIDEASIQNTSDAPLDFQQPSVQNVAERDFLRSEGDPVGMGYTLKEASDLVRSTVAGHRTFALRLIASVLENAMIGLQEQKASFLDLKQRTLKDVDWQAVWAYALGPEAGLTLTLRLALDDTHTTVVVSCARALQALLSCSANNAIFDLHENCWPRMKLVFTGSVFRSHSKQDEGFLGGGRWKYNIKTSELYAFSKTGDSQEEGAEGNETVGDDATVASKDCAAGLIRMGLLPRIRYILEVEKLKAAEEQLLDVIVALARHSPAASEAVMKCPRLLDAIIQRFISMNEDRNDVGHSARTKAIELLKVLSQASRLYCSKFFNSGAIQMAQSELYTQSWSGGMVCLTMVESLRLWQICIQYKMGMSSFMDIYPNLCFWLSPLTKEEILSDRSIDALSLAQESYRLLERLAQTLPRLHLDDDETLESFETDDDENWAWSVAVPFVETALGWLSAECLSAVIELNSKSRQCVTSSAVDTCTVKLIGTLTSVLQFLATVSEKILGSNDGENGHNSHTPFIPTFVPRLGLLLAADKFLYNHDGSMTLFGSLCSIRHIKDDETTLAATFCLHAVVRLFSNVDKVIKTARAESVPASAFGENTPAHKILDAGLVFSSRREFQNLLSRAGDEVISNTCLLQSFEINGRGGPAPGLALGWGALSGGSWSKQVLVAQATARLVMYLLDLVPPCRSKTFVDSHDSSSTEECSIAKMKTCVSEMVWRLSCGFGVAALASPEDGELVKQTCSKLLVHPNILTSLTKAAESNLLELDSVFEDLSLRIEALSKLVPDKMSKVLLEHYTWTWTSRKDQKVPKTQNADGSNLRGILKGKKSGSKLPTVLENASAGARTSLAREWARQRLPLPSHWILSPMASNMSRVLFTSEEEGVGVSTVSIIEKALMEETIKSGLSWLLCLEFLYSQSKSDPFHLIPLVRKVHALSSIYVLGGDVFLQEEVRSAIGVLQEIYGRQLDRPTTSEESLSLKKDKDGTHVLIDQTLDFEHGINPNYTSFGESLAEQFVSTSFGDLVFGRQVGLHLQQGVPDSVRLALWRCVADGQSLRLLPPLSKCCGRPERYLYPLERNDEILAAYVTAWTSGTFDTAVTQAGLSFTLCMHHIAGYLFGNSDVHDKLAVKKVTRTLVRSSMRKSQQQAAFLKLLVYQSSDHNELMDRVAFLREASDGDRTLLSHIERLQRLATPVQ